MEQLKSDFGHAVGFLLVYVREAHPTDEWDVPSNHEAGIDVAQPTSFEARCEVASSCVAGLDLTIPTVVDSLDDRVSRLYGAWPERLYVVDAQGEVSYKGAMGPFGFKPDEVREHLLEYYDLEVR